jgi:hypothetical protein
MFLDPGRGCGGSCFPTDLMAVRAVARIPNPGKPPAPHRAIGLRNIHKANVCSIQLKLGQNSKTPRLPSWQFHSLPTKPVDASFWTADQNVLIEEELRVKLVVGIVGGCLAGKIQNFREFRRASVVSGQQEATRSDFGRQNPI